MIVLTERYIINAEKRCKKELFGGSNFFPVHTAMEAPMIVSKTAGGAIRRQNAK
jgi:hypothetical protein